MTGDKTPDRDAPLEDGKQLIADRMKQDLLMASVKLALLVGAILLILFLSAAIQKARTRHNPWKASSS